MRTWKQYREDHDSDRSGSKAELLEFFEKRRRGASQIANEARSKGGPSQLTAWHFSAKDRPYQEVLAAIRSNRNEGYFRQKCTSLANRFRFNKLDQQSFQELMGELEVWGEALAKLWS